MHPREPSLNALHQLRHTHPESLRISGLDAPGCTRTSRLVGLASSGNRGELLPPGSEHGRGCDLPGSDELLLRIFPTSGQEESGVKPSRIGQTIPNQACLNHIHSELSYRIFVPAQLRGANRRCGHRAGCHLIAFGGPWSDRQVGG